MAAALAGTPAWAAVLRTQEEALRGAFPGGEVERETRFLDDAQAASVEAAAGSRLDSRVVIRYRGSVGGRAAGVAYFDTHLVRTLPETILVLVDPDGRVGRIEILSFDEPPDYLPKEKWLDQFSGKELSEDLSMKRGIRGITGATLSSRAITAAVRRVLAIDGELRAAPMPAPGAPRPGEPRP